MPLDLFHNPAPLGIDLGRASIKLLQFDRAVNPTRVAAAARFDLLPLDLRSPADVAEALTEALRCARQTSRLNARQAAVSLSDHDLTYTETRDPSDAGSARPSDSPCRTDIPLAGTDSDPRHLAVSADPAVVAAVIGALESARLMPIAVEPAPTVIARALTHRLRRKADRQRTRAIVDLGSSGSRLLILHGPQVAAYHTLGVGGAALDAAIASHLGISPRDAADFRLTDLRPADTADTVEPVTASASTPANPHPSDAVMYATAPLVDMLADFLRSALIRYATDTGQPAPDVLLAIGGHGREPWLREALQRRLSLRLLEAAPLDNLDISDPGLSIDRRGSLAAWTVAAGLALRRPIPRFGFTHAA